MNDGTSGHIAITIVARTGINAETIVIINV
jgi:hypothetical protein